MTVQDQSADVPVEIIKDPEEVAAAANLHYVSDEMPGIRRKRWGRGFTYLDEHGEHITGDEQRQRFEALVIPPAWTDVWICPDPNGHILATGRDDAGRKQYIYHPRWQEVRNENKFNRMILFGQALPGLREQVDADLRRHGLPRERVLAVVVRLLDKTLIRIGNDEYAQRNDSYGLTTLRDKHVKLNSRRLEFEFTGKSGKHHVVDVEDRRLARLVKRCKDVPGYELFQYYDDEGNHHAVDSGMVNAYLNEVTGEDFTAKDFRTWGGTVLALHALRELPLPEDDEAAEENIREAVKRVAEGLGNTEAVCREYYIHPSVLDCYRQGSLSGLVEQGQRDYALHHDRLSDDEEAALALLLACVVGGG